MGNLSEIQKKEIVIQAKQELEERRVKRIELLEKVWQFSEKYAAEKQVENNIFVFDLDEFSQKYELDNDEILELYPEGSDLTTIYDKIYRTLKIPGVKVEFKGLSGRVEISEKSIFRELCKDGNLVFSDIKNLHAINYKIEDEAGFVKDLKPIAAYTRPKIENVTYFNGREFETQKKLLIKDKEVDLTDEINYFDDFIGAVKPSGNFNYIKYLEEYSEIFDYILQRYDDKNKVIKRTIAFGYYGTDKIILNGWESQRESLRAKDFKKNAFNEIQKRRN